MVFITQLLTIKNNFFRTIARLLPHWLSPNALSTIRALLIVPIYFLFRNQQFAWVIILFILALITDILDGVHARTNNQVSTLGKLLDPAADKIVFVGLFLLSAPHRISQVVINVIIALELVLVLLATIVGPLAARLFRLQLKLGANQAGKIKMTLEGLALGLLLLGLQNQTLQQISEGLFWLAAAAALASIILHLTQPTRIQRPADHRPSNVKL